MGRTGIYQNTPVPKNMTKREYFEMKLNDELTEEDDFDLMVMGRSQGAGFFLLKRTYAYNYFFIFLFF